jgi:hypothetical protein
MFRKHDVRFPAESETKQFRLGKRRTVLPPVSGREKRK